MPAVLGIVSPADWLKRTSLTFSRTRGPSLKAVDEAYEAYYTLRSPDNMQRLHDALGAYLVEKGGQWVKVDRNKKSDGLMKFIYESTAPTKMGGGDVLSRRVAESRHGVVHLWMNADVSTQWAKIILEGALDIGGKTLTMFGDDGLKKIPVKYKTLATVGGGAGAVGGIILGVARGAGTGKEVEKLKQTEYRPHSGAVTVNALQTTQTNWQKFKAFLGKAWDTVYTQVTELVKSVWDTIKLTVAGGGMLISGAVSKILEKIVLVVIGEICKAAVPFVGGAIDIGRGVAQAVVGAKDRIKSYLARRKFIVSPGHPTLIVEALETQMNWNIAKGLYNAAKGGAKVAGSTFTAGASVIIDVIAAAVEFVVRMAQRIAEGVCMRSWIDAVKSICGNRNEWKADPKDGVWRPKICFDDKNFTKLFELGCNSSVCVPMLTLNSGICGDQMMFMKMFDDTSAQNVVSQSSFDTATKYFSHLKWMGKEYVTSTGFTFTSPKKDVQGYFWHAVNHHDKGTFSKSDLALKFLAG